MQVLSGEASDDMPWIQTLRLLISLLADYTFSRGNCKGSGFGFCGVFVNFFLIKDLGVVKKRREIK